MAPSLASSALAVRLLSLTAVLFSASCLDSETEQPCDAGPEPASEAGRSLLSLKEHRTRWTGQEDSLQTALGKLHAMPEELSASTSSSPAPGLIAPAPAPGVPASVPTENGTRVVVEVQNPLLDRVLNYLTPIIERHSREMGGLRKAAAKLRHRLSAVAEGSIVLGSLLCIGIGMFFVLYNNKYGGATPRAPASSDAGASFEPASQCDYVMVFPVRGEASSTYRWSGTHVMALKWEQIINGRELAHKIFEEPFKIHMFTAEELDEQFPEQMTVEEYSKTVFNLLMRVFKGHRFELTVERFKSVDNELEYVKLTLPSCDSSEILDAYAVSAGHMMPLSDSCYEEAEVKIPLNSHQDPVHAFTCYRPNDANLFMPFKTTDRLKLLTERMSRVIDLRELVKQGVLAEHFCAHEAGPADELCKTCGNPTLWHRIPDRLDEDAVKDYFGEEVGWLFVWQRFFMVYLVVPALLGSVLFFRRFLLGPLARHCLQIGFAVLMSAWAALFNCMYRRHEAVVRQRWGVHGEEATHSVRDGYDPTLDRTWKVQFFSVLGDCMAITMVCLCVLGVRLVQGLREWMLANHSHKVWQQAAAVLVSLQILVLDMVWRAISKQLADLENHKTTARWQVSWIQKVFLVRIFNNLYPFLYIGFVKQFSYQGCPNTDAGCLMELERYLLTYFVTRLLIHLGTDMFLLFSARAQIRRERRRSASSASQESGRRPTLSLEVQAKSQDYDSVVMLDDWTENLLTFLFLSCFNVILPVISLLALLTTMLETRCLVHRNCRFLRRPVPVAIDGIGEWHRVLEVAEFLAVIVNLGFAIFTISPFRDIPALHKFMIFALAENLVLFVKFLLKSKFPEVPMDVQDINQINDEFVRQATSILQLHAKKIAVNVCRVYSPASVALSPSFRKRVSTFS